MSLRAADINIDLHTLTCRDLLSRRPRVEDAGDKSKRVGRKNNNRTILLATEARKETWGRAATADSSMELNNF